MPLFAYECFAKKAGTFSVRFIALITVVTMKKDFAIPI